MKYGHNSIKDQSYFKNVTFQNLIEGVTNWADDGVTFDACKFMEIDRRGILPYDSEVIVKNGCTFENMPIGVDIITTYPIFFSSKIGLDDEGLDKNRFYCNNVGVYVQSVGNAQALTVFNNEFYKSSFGFEQNGNGYFKIKKNLFQTPGGGLRFYDCGVPLNLVEQNIIQSGFIGASSNKINSGLRYLGNCFKSNGSIDINIQDGNIFYLQGTPAAAAGNCFEGSAIDIDNRAGSSTFDYYTSLCQVLFVANIFEKYFPSM